VLSKAKSPDTWFQLNFIAAEQKATNGNIIHLDLTQSIIFIIMKYSVLPPNDDEDSDGPTRTTASSNLRLGLYRSLPWILCGIFATALLFVSVSLKVNSEHGTFAAGYHTDFISVKPYIKTTQIRFEGSPSFDRQGRMFFPESNGPKYVGDPNQFPEMDQNWNNLTRGRYIIITEDEAESTWGSSKAEFWDEQWGGYVAGFDMFHTLHCLNTIRMALSTGPRSRHDTEPMHVEHCINQLRQFIMCSGDMTPIPTRFYESIGRNYIDSDVLHTCRDFASLRNWLTGRYEGETAVEVILQDK